ncbi:unnamed protein product [Fusarium graminearum]|uniref:Uncharacterized protein n=1 Tax=Gibberella zeae TaxID=5518 RepID=A0A9N8NC21_GIBZA|nr:unnamed protein product [Fusarium graminearum]
MNRQLGKSPRRKLGTKTQRTIRKPGRNPDTTRSRNRVDPGTRKKTSLLEPTRRKGKTTNSSTEKKKQGKSRKNPNAGSNDNPNYA